MLEPGYSSRFKKDYKIAQKRGLDLTLLDEVIRRLIEETPLSPSSHDHALTGSWRPRRECHIKPDWLLIYQVDREEGLIVFERTGTHADLFG